VRGCRRSSRSAVSRPKIFLAAFNSSITQIEILQSSFKKGVLMKSILVLTFFLASNAHALIVGGVDVPAHDPVQQSTAAVYEPSANGQGGALCTASLIGKNTALTAAHCISKDGYAPVMIFGSNVRSPDSVQRPITGVAVNPAWEQKRGRGMDQGDIAVVKFGGKLPSGYHPTTLDTAGSEVKKGDSAILAGYGVSDAHSHEGAGVLRKTTVAVAAPRKGKSEMIFDQSHGRGACHGDSGGPAYFQRGQKMILGGVTNRSYPNSAADDCAHKVVYTKVSAYRPWIEKSEAELNRAPTGLRALPSLASNQRDRTETARMSKRLSRRTLSVRRTTKTQRQVKVRRARTVHARQGPSRRYNSRGRSVADTMRDKVER
jgi:hypothetical protein